MTVLNPLADEIVLRLIDKRPLAFED